MRITDIVNMSLFELANKQVDRARAFREGSGDGSIGDF